LVVLDGRILGKNEKILCPLTHSNISSIVQISTWPEEKGWKKSKLMMRVRNKNPGNWEILSSVSGTEEEMMLDTQDFGCLPIPVDEQYQACTSRFQEVIGEIIPSKLVKDLSVTVGCTTFGDHERSNETLPSLKSLRKILNAAVGEETTEIYFKDFWPVPLPHLAERIEIMSSRLEDTEWVDPMSLGACDEDRGTAGSLHAFPTLGEVSRNFTLNRKQHKSFVIVGRHLLWCFFEDLNVETVREFERKFPEVMKDMQDQLIHYLGGSGGGRPNAVETCALLGLSKSVEKLCIPRGYWTSTRHA
jgi:hypothetical protein